MTGDQMNVLSVLLEALADARHDGAIGVEILLTHPNGVSTFRCWPDAAEPLPAVNAPCSTRSQ